MGQNYDFLSKNFFLQKMDFYRQIRTKSISFDIFCEIWLKKVIFSEN